MKPGAHNGWQRVTASPDDGDMDEIVANGVSIHVERMSDGQIWFALRRDDSDTKLHFWFTAERKHVLRSSAYWDGPPWPDVVNEVSRWTGKRDMT